MNAFKLLSEFLNEQTISYSKTSVSKNEDGNKEQESKTNFSGNLVGLADKKHFKEQDANPAELAAGIKVEFEHTDDPNISKKIALDHLAEIPDYYTRLAEMEKQAKEGNSNEQV